MISDILLGIENNKELVFVALRDQWWADPRDRLVTDCLKFDEYCEKFMLLKITVDMGLIPLEVMLKGSVKAYVMYFCLYDLSLEPHEIESKENYELVKAALDKNIDNHWSEYYEWIKKEFHNYMAHLKTDTDLPYIR
ncbi:MULTISPECIES: hypothetical protein [Pseudomonas]|uniref:Immunity protein 63 domain-containing protein n=1 Tax=Pseudomonas paracarnis TaxID=2750625 RepID=A0ABU6BQ31_9PSED|nr:MULTISPECIES: hypothetical protein [Pseudomonas]HDS0926280.1 hypothetical protein [Pseudomonas putida]MBA1220019.1 hypothetical protein [Pseudomonas fulva]MBR7522399.1 hypothetical protein [Pseudomonas juntendi]MDG9889219.1 hypothetical protein [Pseudomonas juntendi]MEB3782413.1 hypothetical protein [Pseudomonas paracarnis]